MYAYGDAAYAMYEKAPEQIQVSFPIICGVIADFNNMQTMIQEFLEKHAKSQRAIKSLGKTFFRQAKRQYSLYKQYGHTNARINT